MHHHVTVIALQSVHRPTDDEVVTVLDSMIATAEHCGFEPLRARALFEDLSDVNGTRSPGDERNPCELSASRVVHDGVKQGKWERT